jgi:predicted Zn-dependent peptidase
LQIKALCLNEDFSKTVDLINEVITNSTFEEFEKEKNKLKGEILAELDSSRARALDKYCRLMFENHYYGHSMTKISESIDSITKEDVIEAYQEILNNSKKVLAVIGALDKSEILPQIEDKLGSIPPSIEGHFNIEQPKLTEKKEGIQIKSDLNQAHIAKGWQVPTYGEADYPALILLNVILGASGLSSRLFLELRDKKGLAYVVRSSYETYKLAGNFMIYIATEPNNIDVSLKGFDEEIEKIRTIPVSEEELNDAKNNILGKYSFLEETNMQQACTFAKYGVLGFGFDYLSTVKESIKNVTSEQVLNCAKKYFNETSVLSIIKP